MSDDEQPITLYVGNPLDKNSIASKFLVEIWGGKEIIQLQQNGLVTLTYDIEEAEELEKALHIALIKWREIFKGEKR